MKSSLYTLYLGLVAFIGLTGSIAAKAAPEWKVSPTMTSIKFIATKNDAPITGEFKQFTLTTHFDPEQLDTSSVQLDIDMNSVTTTDDKLTATIKSSDWLDVEHYPHATFQSNTFTSLKDNQYEADGNLTIRDKTLPVKLIFNSPEYSKYRFRANGNIVLKRSDFGIGQGELVKTDKIKDEFKVTFTLYGYT